MKTLKELTEESVVELEKQIATARESYKENMIDQLQKLIAFKNDDQFDELSNLHFIFFQHRQLLEKQNKYEKKFLFSFMINTIDELNNKISEKEKYVRAMKRVLNQDKNSKKLLTKHRNKSKEEIEKIIEEETLFIESAKMFLSNEEDSKICSEYNNLATLYLKLLKSHHNIFPELH